MKRLFVILLCFSLSQVHAQSDYQLVLDCLKPVFGEQVDIDSEVAWLENELVRTGILTDTTVTGYRAFLRDTRQDPQKIIGSIDTARMQYVSEAAFFDCAANNYGLIDESTTAAKHFTLVMVYAFIAKEKATITLYAEKDTRINVRGKQVGIDQLPATLLDEKNKMLAKGINEADIKVNLSAHPDTKMGLLVDIQTVIKEVNIRKVQYMTVTREN